jgi:hypothetical protein
MQWDRRRRSATPRGPRDTPGQRVSRTVNPSAYAYSGSNPLPATLVRGLSASGHAFESPRIVTVCHDSRETLRRCAQCFGLRVHIRGHREGLRRVPQPRRNYRDQHVLQVHQCSARVPCVVEPNVANAGGFEHARPPRRQRVRTERGACFVDHHVAASWSGMGSVRRPARDLGVSSTRCLPNRSRVEEICSTIFCEAAR